MKLVPVRENTKKDLDKLKLVEGEFYDSVIKRLIKEHKENDKQ